MNFDDIYSWVKGLPVVDWHNHLDMQMLADDRPLGSLYEVWVKADPYKHRAMRICGEAECAITGDAPEDEKWAAWMRTLPKLVGNPLFVWAKMELAWLGADPEPYLHGVGENISLAEWTASKMLKKFNVEFLSPCVGPGDLPSLDQPAPRRSETPPLGQRASRPLEAAPLGERVPLTSETPSLGQRASRPLTWSAPQVKEFPSAQACVSSHFSHTLAAGDFHRRNLPHLGQSSTLVFVTFRLADSLSKGKLEELAAYKEAWMKDHPEPWDESTRREWKETAFPKIDELLDAGHGTCILADPVLRKVVEDALEYFNDASPAAGSDATTGRTGVSPVGSDVNAGRTGDPPVGREEGLSCSNGRDARCPSGVARGSNGRDARCPSRRYRLHSYVVMPNHVHVLFELFDAADIDKVLHSWKSCTAKRLNELTGGSGKVWKEEYYDRLIRNGEHYQNTIRYIRRNGAAARWLAESNGRDARCPSGVADVNGRDARCPSLVPSLRMSAGEEVGVETLERFHEAGCRVVDISVDDVAQLSTCFTQLAAVAAYAAAHGWTMLLHMGALRETSARLRAAAGPAGGFAGMRAPVDPTAVAAFLNALENGGGAGSNGRDARCPSWLPRTILMSLNPEAHAQLAVLAGSFNGEGMPGKVQLGPAWWWCDHEEGIRDVLEKNAAYGVLSTFVGMTTDSRSLLSFVRHEYFRRILCKWVAGKVASGAFPDDESLLRPLLENICYKNAKGMVS